MRPTLSSIFSDRDLALMAMLPSAFNEWVERAVSQYAIPDLLAMATGEDRRRADNDERRREMARRASLAEAMDPDDLSVSAEHGIAVARISGVLSPYYWDAADARGISATIRQVGANPAIRTLVLDIDSPGGHAVHIREMADSIRSVAENGTRVVAHVGPGNMAASAAYWTAAAADEIYGATSSWVGSVGVFSALYEFSGLLGKLGVSLKLFRDGALKGMGLFGKSLTDAESAHIQAGVDRVSAEFKGFVRSRRRGIADETMQGQVFEGVEAVEARLLDGHVDDLADLLAIEMARL